MWIFKINIKECLVQACNHTAQDSNNHVVVVAIFLERINHNGFFSFVTNSYLILNFD